MINENDRQDAQNALNQATRALRRGDRAQTRRWASLAARLDPTNEQPWMLMAAVASPQASVAYLQKALEINPASQPARKGMEWAVRRLRQQQAAASPAPRPVSRSYIPASINVPTRPVGPVLPSTQPIAVHRLRRPPLWAVGIFLIVLVGLCVAGLSGAWIVLANSGTAERAISVLISGTATPTLPAPTATDLPTETSVPTLPPTNTTEPPTVTPELPTATLEPQATQTPELEDATITPNSVPTLTSAPPTDTPEPTQPPPDLPEGVGAGERWIDVDLSEQLVYAYEGDNMVNQFLVSTGTWLHPTVTGQFNIYVKYRYADMSGPGYYLADVPYVMYFYKGYGLHGTYWHSNFGTPMSHGCVNLQTDEAGWLFEWASVGTVVNVHD